MAWGLAAIIMAGWGAATVVIMGAAMGMPAGNPPGMWKPAMVMGGAWTT
jgi:hypothetical protein